MPKITHTINRLLNIAAAASLAIMSILIFCNVLLRYLFNSGIVWAEEVARFLFVWITFLGAIGALKDNQHLGVDMLVKRLPPLVKKITFVISNGLVLYILWLIGDRDSPGGIVQCGNSDECQYGCHHYLETVSGIV